MTAASTIAAISTPPGKGGVAIIRISGDEALNIANSIFKPKGKYALLSAPRRQIYGDILRGCDVIDDGMAIYFKAPFSYTGEDIVEISCHGGMLITKEVLTAALSAGAIPAEAGEFTRRAYLNGKLSLTDAEAIGLLLEAESEAQIKLSRKSSRDKLTERLGAARTELTSLLSSIYARIDYPDEDLGDFTDEQTLAAIKEIKEDLNLLLDTYKTGRAITEGIKTSVLGKPNVGKSTLYNLLLGEDAAIVTDIPGTTRDLLHANISLGDVMLRITDTAGVHESQDRVEKIGIDRSRDAAIQSDLVFVLFDASRPLDDDDEAIISLSDTLSAQRVAVLTKCDLDFALSPSDTEKINKSFGNVLEISAKQDSYKAKLDIIKITNKLFTDEKIRIGDDAIISSARQKASLTRAYEFLCCASDALSAGMPQDAVSSDIELALGAIGELDGRSVSEAVVADIFSKFCVGK